MSDLFTSVSINSALIPSTTVDFSVGAGAYGPYRVTDIDWQQQIVGTPEPKLQGYGSWPTWRDIRLLVITMEGTIVGTTASDYWAMRKALAAAIVPPPGFNRAVRYHGTLTVTVPSVGAVWALVNLVDYSMPVSHATGNTSRYQFTWQCDLGYWTSGSTAISL